MPFTDTRRRLMAAGLATGIATLAAGCGFKLRGSTEFSFDTLYAGFQPGSPITAEFHRAMRLNSKVRLVDNPAQAQVRLEASREIREKEVVSFSSAGRPREYQLRLRLSFRLTDGSGKELIPWSELLLRRELTTGDTQLVAKAQEDAILFREMQKDMVDQMILRLGAVRR